MSFFHHNFSHADTLKKFSNNENIKPEKQLIDILEKLPNTTGWLARKIIHLLDKEFQMNLGDRFMGDIAYFPPSINIIHSKFLQEYNKRKALNTTISTQADTDSSVLSSDNELNTTIPTQSDTDSLVLLSNNKDMLDSKKLNSISRKYFFQDYNEKSDFIYKKYNAL